MTDENDSIRGQYERHGAAAYYREHAGEYVNPHEPEIDRCLELAVKSWPLDLSHVLDLAAGSGEVTLSLRKLGATRVDGCEPFLFEQYQRRAGTAAERFTFEDIAAGALADRLYSLIVCSFALHLADASRLPGICHQLSLISPTLVILTPHKRPHIEAGWGWKLTDEFVKHRVRARLYASDLLSPVLGGEG